LLDLGYLKTFYTSSYIASRAIQQLAQKNEWSSLSRRFLPGLGGNYVHSAFKYEIKELLYRKIKGNNQRTNELVVKRDVQFDTDLSKKLGSLSYDLFWGFQGSSRNCLQVSNDLGKETVCEMTSAYLPFAKKMLQEEAELHPEWADSIDVGYFPSYYEERLLEEPIIAKKIIAISTFLKHTLVQEGVAADKISVVPLGFDVNNIPFVPETSSVDNRPLRLLYAGKITQHKGIKYLLEAIKQFSKKDVELYIIGNVYGSGEAFRRYKDQYVYQKGISQKDLFNAYSRYDALVFPSIMEGFGLVTVEAMGAGLPVITTPNTNAAELLVNGKNGFVVPIRDTAAIAAAIGNMRAMTNTEFQEMRQHARHTALQYSWDAHTARIASFLKK